MKKKNPFRDNKPGRSWYEAFLKRNPEISERISENVTLNRAKVSEQSLRSWFKEVSEYLIDQDLITIEPEFLIATKLVIKYKLIKNKL